MVNRIICATDGSEASDGAVAFANSLAHQLGGEVTVVHCVEFTLPGKGGGRYPVHANEDELQAKIERQVADMSTDGVKATLQLGRAAVGGAAQVIADTARDERGDVIVVGTRGHSPLAGLLIGSVTQRLLHIAPCPVISVPGCTESAEA
jgi:nucleotide-binding universal stress UspA family protein